MRARLESVACHTLFYQLPFILAKSRADVALSGSAARSAARTQFVLVPVRKRLDTVALSTDFEVAWLSNG